MIKKMMVFTIISLMIQNKIVAEMPLAALADAEVCNGCDVQKSSAYIDGDFCCIESGVDETDEVQDLEKLPVTHIKRTSVPPTFQMSLLAAPANAYFYTSCAYTIAPSNASDGSKDVTFDNAATTLLNITISDPDACPGSSASTRVGSEITFELAGTYFVTFSLNVTSAAQAAFALYKNDILIPGSIHYSPAASILTGQVMFQAYANDVLTLRNVSTALPGSGCIPIATTIGNVTCPTLNQTSASIAIVRVM